MFSQCFSYRLGGGCTCPRCPQSGVILTCCFGEAAASRKLGAEDLVTACLSILICFVMYDSYRWILSHISAYSVRRRIYVLWLNSVMLVAGGLATIPCISWGHKVYWMVISCVPFPELCYHIWRMLSDAIESSEPLSGRFSLSGLYFVRVFGQFSYQLFPAIYFAAYDGCLPLYVSEPLWSICDWCLKMCMTSSLMEAEFFTVAQVCRISLCIS